MEQKIIKDEKGHKFRIFEPPDEVFLYKVRNRNHVMQNDALEIPSGQNDKIPMLDTKKGINGVEYPETGGMYIWHIGRKYPRKGHAYPQALKDTFYPKRVLVVTLGFLASKDMIPFFVIFGLLPRRWKGR